MHWIPLLNSRCHEARRKTARRHPESVDSTKDRHDPCRYRCDTDTAPTIAITTTAAADADAAVVPNEMPMM